MTDYTTTSTQLEDYAKQLKLPLIQVVSKDELNGPVLVGSYIINMEDSDKGNGTHWVLLKVFPNKEVIYYDSFGLPVPRQIREFIRRKIGWSNREIQHVNATTCGLYCLACDHYLTYQRRRDIYERFDDWLNMFKVDTKKNDKILLHYLEINGFKRL